MCRAKHTRVPDLSPFFLTKPHMLILVLLYILQTGRKEKAGWILILQNIKGESLDCQMLVEVNPGPSEDTAKKARY